jgi:hypothetical protein
MSRSLRDDVAAWQAGVLSADELRARHPGAEVESALAAHGALAALAAAPVPDADQAWSRLAATLPTQLAPRASRRFRRPVVAAVLAGVLAGPAVSYAVAPDAVRSGIRQVTDLFTDRDDDPRPADPVPVDGPKDTTQEPGVEVELTDPRPTADDRDGAGQNQVPGDDDPSDEGPAAGHDEPSDDRSPGTGTGSSEGEQPEATTPSSEVEDRLAPSSDGTGIETHDGAVEPSATEAPSGD